MAMLRNKNFRCARRYRCDGGYSVDRLGVAPSTLRTWNRRYGIGAQELSPGKHRRYTAEDIVRLEHMQKLILRGAAPAMPPAPP